METKVELQRSTSTPKHMDRGANRKAEFDTTADGKSFETTGTTLQKNSKEERSMLPRNDC